MRYPRRNKNMSNTYKYSTREGAIKQLQKFFDGITANEITVSEAFKAWGRDPQPTEQNKSWLSNKLTHLKIHRLVKPVYIHNENNRRSLDKIQLLPEGLAALGRSDYKNASDGVTSTKLNTDTILLEDIMKAIPRIQKENPNFEITLSVTPKSG